jgi:hypothetical protein
MWDTRTKNWQKRESTEKNIQDYQNNACAELSVYTWTIFNLATIGCHYLLVHFCY